MPRFLSHHAKGAVGHRLEIQGWAGRWERCMHNFEINPQLESIEHYQKQSMLRQPLGIIVVGPWPGPRSKNDYVQICYTCVTLVTRMRCSHDQEFCAKGKVQKSLGKEDVEVQDIQRKLTILRSKDSEYRNRFFECLQWWVGKLRIVRNSCTNRFMRKMRHPHPRKMSTHQSTC